MTPSRLHQETHQNSVKLEFKTSVQNVWDPQAFESTCKEGSYCAGWVIDPDFEGEFGLILQNGGKIDYVWASLVAQLIKNLPAMQEILVWFLGWEDPWRRNRVPTPVFTGFPGGSDGKESTFSDRDLGWEDPPEQGMATHSSILAWRIPKDRGAWSAMLQ